MKCAPHCCSPVGLSTTSLANSERFADDDRGDARSAPGEMAAERTGATARDRVQRAEVSLWHGGAVACEVVLPVPDDDVGHAGASKSPA